MANTNSNRKLVPEAMDSLDRFKYEVASDIAVKNIFESNVSLATKRYFKPLSYLYYQIDLIH